MEFFKYTLPNGIRCIYKRVKSPVAWCAMTINAGSRDELTSQYGAAHFTEHLLFKGTEKRRAHHINNRLEKLGGELNAFTTKEETVVHATVLKGDIPKAAELISDVVFHSVFPAKEVEREREVILDEINSYKDSPPDRIYDEFEDMLFAGSSLGHDILGTRSTVGRLGRDDISGFTGRTYNTDQMVFSLVGNLTEKSFLRIVERYFADMARSEREFVRQLPEDAAVFEKAINRNTYQAHCILGNRAYGNSDPRRIVMSLLINILGGPAANSKLNTLLREKNGLTYNAEASYTPYCDTGIAAIYFGSEKDKVQICIELIDGLLTGLKDRRLTGRQLAAAKKQFIGQLAVSMENREGYMLSAGKSLLVYDDVDTPEMIYRKIEAITAADIMEVANEVFGQTSKLIYR